MHIYYGYIRNIEIVLESISNLLDKLEYLQDAKEDFLLKNRGETAEQIIAWFESQIEDIKYEISLLKHAKTMELKSLKIGKRVEITYDRAHSLIKGTPLAYEFENMNESTAAETGFEEVQNRRYYIEKTGRKGSVVEEYNGAYKCKVGIFNVIMTWDYRHPKNFSMNENNLEKYFLIYE